MKTRICLKNTWKLALSASLYILSPVILTAQTADNKEVLPHAGVPQPELVKDSTSAALLVYPVISDVQAPDLKESDRKDISANEKKDSFTPSQDEWLKNAGYYKSKKMSGARKNRRK